MCISFVKHSIAPKILIQILWIRQMGIHNRERGNKYQSHAGVQWYIINEVFVWSLHSWTSTLPSILWMKVFLSLQQKKPIIKIKTQPQGTMVCQTTYTSFKVKHISMIAHLDRGSFWTQGGLSNGPNTPWVWVNLGQCAN